MATTPHPGKPPGAYHSYLIRLWQDNAQSPWRVSAHSVQTGQTHLFTSLEALYAFLDDQCQMSDGGRQTIDDRR